MYQSYVDSDTLTLGKFRPSKNIDGTENWDIPANDSYNAIAESNGDMYFDMKDGLYKDIQNNYNFTEQDMFDAFNTRALDKAVNENKIIRFSEAYKTATRFFKPCRCFCCIKYIFGFSSCFVSFMFFVIRP